MGKGKGREHGREDQVGRRLVCTEPGRSVTRDRKGNWRKEPRTDETSLEIWKTGRKIISEG